MLTILAVVLAPMLDALNDYESFVGLRLRENAIVLARNECDMKLYEWQTKKMRAQMCRTKRKMAFDDRLRAARRCRIEGRACKTVQICGEACVMPEKLLKTG